MRGVFVTGTGTGVGKSIVAAAICAGLAAKGLRVAAFKPVVTGLDDEPAGWPPDHELLAAAAGGQRPEDVAPYRFGPPVSPHYAAELAETAIEADRLIRAALRAGEAADALVVEGVGGLLVPITGGYLVRNLAVDLALPVVIAAAPGLGTINHTLLTVESARSAGLDVRAVVFTPWPAEPDGVALSNRRTIATLAEIEVICLPAVDRRTLAAAGAVLPIDSWTGTGS